MNMVIYFKKKNIFHDEWIIHRRSVEVKNIGDKKNIDGQIVEWEIKTKRHKVESNKRRMRQDI
jgi:hypothetical protein